MEREVKMFHSEGDLFPFPWRIPAFTVCFRLNRSFFTRGNKVTKTVPVAAL